MNLLLDSALYATVLLLAAWIASIALRRASADVRYTVWLIAILAVTLIPAVLSLPKSAVPAQVRIVVPVISTSAGIVARKLPWMVMIWGAGAAVVLTRLLAGTAAAMRIKRSARLMDGILYSDLAATPMTWGFLRPVVILPCYAMEWTASERDLVIRHEQAHVARRDWLWQTLSTLVIAVFWFHPLMWLARIQLRREAENAVDDMVLSNGVRAVDYAARLVDVARHVQGISTPIAFISMVHKPELEMRICAILDGSKQRTSAGIFARCAVALGALAMIVPAGLTAMQGEAQKVGGDISPPAITHKEAPKYTKEADKAKIQGIVKLRAVISTEGHAEEIEVLKSLGYGLDEKAIEALQHWTFRPGRKNGEPVRVYATIEINFHLK